jgi:hypothetical protein
VLTWPPAVSKHQQQRPARQQTRFRADISALAPSCRPKRLDLLIFQKIVPTRHLVLAARHRADEALVLLMKKLAKIK